MSEENSTIRKIYVLPRELADRITAFQQEKNLPSEVEAVRRLLDEALKYRDTANLIIERFRERLKSDGIPSSVAKDVLIGHPLVTSIGQEDLDHISFTMKDGESYRVAASGHSEIWNQRNEYWEKFPYKPDFDDSIPF